MLILTLGSAMFILSHRHWGCDIRTQHWTEKQIVSSLVAFVSDIFTGRSFTNWIDLSTENSSDVNGVFPEWTRFSLNSLNLLILSVNCVFVALWYHLCLSGKSPGFEYINHFYFWKKKCYWIQQIQWKHLGKTPVVKCCFLRWHSRNIKYAVLRLSPSIFWTVTRF